VARSGPPAYAWDWFARQRLLWREARSRLTAAAAPAASRYHAVDTRAEVIALLRADYGRDPLVRDVIHRVVADVAFLGRTDVRFAELGIRNPPRGLAWWWSAVTGEDTAGRSPAKLAASDAVDPPAQLRLDEVQQGWGG
jgi:hypothetical protein